MVGRNDPCPCGSGKKYKKCCLNKEQQVTGMVSEGMVTETVQAFQQMLMLLVDDYAHILPEEMVEIENEQLGLIYQVSVAFESARTKKNSDGVPYIDVILEKVKKNQKRESVIRSIEQWHEIEPVFFEITDEEDIAVRAINAFTGEEAMLMLPEFEDQEMPETIYGLPLQCGPYHIFPSGLVDLNANQMDFLFDLFTHVADDDGQTIDAFLKEYHYVFPAVDHVDELMGEVDTLDAQSDFALLPEEREVLVGIRNIQSPEIDAEVIESMEATWFGMIQHDYIPFNRTEPMVAAFEYVYRDELYPENYKKVTLKWLAEKYGTSSGAISNRKNQIEEFFDAELEEPFGPSIIQQSPGNRFGSPTEDLFKAMEQQTFESDEDIERFIAQWNQTGGEGMRPEESDAEQLFRQATELPPEEAKPLLEKAMELDPDYIDAHVMYAEQLDNDGKMKHLKRAIEIGQKTFGKSFEEENAGDYWLIFETRPFMRALYGYGQHMVSTGNYEEAIQIFERILHLNDSDNLGVRYDLIPLCIIDAQCQKAKELFEQFPENTTIMLYHRVLYEYHCTESDEALEQAIRNAKKNNHFIVPAIETFDSVGEPTSKVGQEAWEAGQYAKYYRQYWDEQLIETVSKA